MKYPIGIQSFERIISDGEADKRKLFRIGVNFSSETGTINDWKLI